MSSPSLQPSGPLDPMTRVPVLLDGLPTATFEAAVTYLKDVLRECQLVLVGRSQGSDGDPMLSQLAEGLVPDLEEVGDAFDASEISPGPGGTLRLSGSLLVAQAATLSHLQMQLIQLRLLGRRGGLLVTSDPHVTQLLVWIWEELSDQLHGRQARAYRAAT